MKRTMSQWPFAVLFFVNSFGRIKALMIVFIAFFSVLPLILNRSHQKDIKYYRHALQVAETNLQQVVLNSKVTPNQNQSYLIGFESLLGERKFVEQDLKKILELAAKSEVVIRTGDYKLSDKTEVDFVSYRLRFPARGSYVQLRRFIEETLLAMPNIALSEVNFNRETIANSIVESNITFNLYIGMKTAELEAKRFE